MAAADWLAINLAVGPAYLASREPSPPEATSAAPKPVTPVTVGGAAPQRSAKAWPPATADTRLAVPEASGTPPAEAPPPAPEPSDSDIEVTTSAERVSFGQQSAELSEATCRTLKSVAQDLTRNSKARVVIEGHADRRGSVELNQWLSMQRARSVRTYLQSLGVSPSRMKVIAHGSTRPLDTSGTEAGRAKNRRVELTIK